MASLHRIKNRVLLVLSVVGLWTLTSTVLNLMNFLRGTSFVEYESNIDRNGYTVDSTWSFFRRSTSAGSVETSSSGLVGTSSSGPVGTSTRGGSVETANSSGSVGTETSADPVHTTLPAPIIESSFERNSSLFTEMPTRRLIVTTGSIELGSHRADENDSTCVQTFLRTYERYCEEDLAPSRFNIEHYTVYTNTNSSVNSPCPCVKDHQRKNV